MYDINGSYNTFKHNQSMNKICMLKKINALHG